MTRTLRTTAAGLVLAVTFGIGAVVGVSPTSAAPDCRLVSTTRATEFRTANADRYPVMREKRRVVTRLWQCRHHEREVTRRWEWRPVNPHGIR